MLLEVPWYFENRKIKDNNGILIVHEPYHVTTNINNKYVFVFYFQIRMLV